jgi:hypothetical protein
MAIDEEEEIAAQWISSEALFYESVEPVVALAKIDCDRVREDAYRAARAKDHPSARSIAAADLPGFSGPIVSTKLARSGLIPNPCTFS